MSEKHPADEIEKIRSLHSRPDPNPVGVPFGSQNGFHPENLPLDIQPEEDSSPELSKILKILYERKEAGYVRGSQSDGHYLALSFGPGGWSGEVALAMGMELDRAGLLEYFDVFEGQSVGCLLAIYAAAKQFKDGLKVFTDFMTQRGKIPKIEDLREAMFNEYPLQIDKIPDDLLIIVGVTNLYKHGTRILRSDEMTKSELQEWTLRACHMPYIGGRPPKVEDENGVEAVTDTNMSVANSASFTVKANQYARQHNKPLITDMLALENILPKEATLANRIQAGLFNRPLDAYIKHYDPTANPDNVFQASISGGGQFSNIRAYKQEFEGSELGDSFVVEDEGQNIYVERIYPAELEDLPDLLVNPNKPGAKAKLRRGWDAGRMAMLSFLNPGLDLTQPRIITSKDLQRPKPTPRPRPQVRRVSVPIA